MKYLIALLFGFLTVTILPATTFAGEQEEEEDIVLATPEEMAAFEQNLKGGKDSASLKLANEYVKRKNFVLAEKWFRYALFKDIGRGALELYRLHKDGHIILPNSQTMKELGINMVTTEANNGNGSSSLFLGEAYLQGAFLETDYEAAYKWFLKAEQQGKPMGSYYLGMSYVNGLNHLTSHRKALRHFKRASDGGVAEGSRQVGIAYHTGLGVAKNVDKARDYYLTGSEQGSALAMRDLANLYKIEYKNTKEYVSWMKRAAGLGDLDAYYFLGKHYEKKSPKKSTQYYEAAAKGSHHLARIKVDKSYTK